MTEAQKPWMEGRTRAVRVFLTDEEHAIVRAAAAKADRSVSRFSVEAIVRAAQETVGTGGGTPAKPRPHRKSK
jgi:uncharacterized protein (DUF1778 family)